MCIFLEGESSGFHQILKGVYGPMEVTEVDSHVSEMYNTHPIISFVVL